MRWILPFLLGSLALPAQADVYHCKVDGRTILQGHPCPDGSTITHIPGESQQRRPQAEFEPHPDSKWRVSVGRSPMDDSKRVVLLVNANRVVRDKFGKEYRPSLVVRCAENTTSMYINFDGMFMADINSYGNVRLRIDDRSAFNVSMTESTDNEALGLWRDESSVSILRRLLGGEELTVRATPYSESPITTTFPIAGLGHDIAPLRQACRW